MEFNVYESATCMSGVSYYSDNPALPCTGELSCNTDTKTLVLWDYLISIGDEVGTDSPLPCATDKPLDRLDLGKFQFHYFFLPFRSP